MFTMADYKSMYYSLSGAVANAIEILIAAQQAGEEAYISAENPIISLLHKEKEPDQNEE